MHSLKEKQIRIAIRIANVIGLILAGFAIHNLLFAWWLNGFGDPYPEAVRMRDIWLYQAHIIAFVLFAFSFLFGIFRPSLKLLLLTIVLYGVAIVSFDIVQHYIWLHFEAIHY